MDLHPSLKEQLPADSPSVTGLVFLTIIILGVNYFNRDTTAIKEDPDPIKQEFPEEQYKSRLKRFCGFLLEDLNSLDREGNWSAEVFTPLDAEVEVRSGPNRVKKLTNLLDAIRSDRNSRAFMVLGDPGSGKSVALRKLCRDLLKEVSVTGKVPLYVNLREWQTKEKWTEENPPTVDQLYAFVKQNLANRGDVFTKDFLDAYFKQMFERGRLFIVFDSFDELPSVMDVNEGSWLIDRLSAVCYQFLAGAHESRGVLASRIFRRPTDAFAAKTILEIKPFSEKKIVATLKKSFSYDERLVKTLFTARRELVPIARNPFTAGLISSFAAEHDNELPATQAELYSSYIQHRLAACADRIQSRELTIKRVIEGAIEISNVMLTTERLGLEAPVDDLVQLLPTQRVLDVVDILTYARIGRLGGGSNRRFSFVHRRFNEYFVVQKLTQDPASAPITDIPTDSRWRDALVLYCEIADPQHAKDIAEFCWKEICVGWGGPMNKPEFLRAVHCLRFLKDAFRARSDSLTSFRHDLAVSVQTQISDGQNLLSKKIAVETLGLLAPEDMDSTLQTTLEQNNPWLDEEALKSCHYLPKVSNQLGENLRLFLHHLGIVEFLKKRKDLLFAFSLSDAFKDVRRFCVWRTIDALSLTFAYVLNIILFFVVSPLAAIIWGLFFGTFPFSGRPIFRKPKVLIMFRLFFWAFLILPWTISEPLWRRSPFESISGPFRALVIFDWLVACPIYLFVYYRPRTIRFDRKGETFKLSLMKYRKFFIELTKLTIGTIVVIGAACGIFLLANWLLYWLLPQTAPIVGSILTSVMKTVTGLLVLSVILMWFISNGRIKRLDRRRLKLLRTNVPTSRDRIAEEFERFHQAEFRLEFVKLIAERGIKPTGSWGDGTMPNYFNDEASTLLAQLEEKWLGLNR